MKIQDFSRRNFIKTMGSLGAGMLFGCAETQESLPSRVRGAQYMGDFAAPALKTVRCAFIGVGARGPGHARQIAEIAGTEIVAISDLYEDLAKKAAEQCTQKGGGERHQDISLYSAHISRAGLQCLSCTRSRAPRQYVRMPLRYAATHILDNLPIHLSLSRARNSISSRIETCREANPQYW